MGDYVAPILHKCIKRVEAQWTAFQRFEVEVTKNCLGETSILFRKFSMSMVIMSWGTLWWIARAPHCFYEVLVVFSLVISCFMGASCRSAYKEISWMQEMIDGDSWRRTRLMEALSNLGEELDRTLGVPFDARKPMVRLANARDRVWDMKYSIRLPSEVYLKIVIGILGSSSMFLIMFVCLTVFGRDELLVSMGVEYTLARKIMEVPT
ncbi:hypothetical protein ABFS83_02G074700 [Erythranthe nasuta]